MIEVRNAPTVAPGTNGRQLMTLCVDVVVENGELVALDFASHEYRIEQVVNCRTGERHPEFLAATVRPRSA